MEWLPNRITLDDHAPHGDQVTLVTAAGNVILATIIDVPTGVGVYRAVVRDVHSGPTADTARRGTIVEFEQCHVWRVAAASTGK